MTKYCVHDMFVPQVVVGQSQRFLEQEEGGYRPCDPAITVERIQQLENAYAELVHLAVERRSVFFKNKVDKYLLSYTVFIIIIINSLQQFTVGNNPLLRKEILAHYSKLAKLDGLVSSLASLSSDIVLRSLTL